jgi:8-oxo-dGTP pyrophosphatase MutT (NUDIX family)
LWTIHYSGHVVPTHEVAIIILRDDEGRYFIHQRRADRDTFPSRWGVGAGGKVESGESPDDAAQRELWEEAGCIPH